MTHDDPRHPTEIDDLRAALRTAIEERDRARDTAVTLEQELAAAYRLLGDAGASLRSEFSGLS